MLKPVLSRGKFRCIGATTTDEYKKYIERDPALERRFQPILLEPPSPASTLRILSRVRKAFESFHGVVISNEALVEAVELSERYIADRFLPDKAIDVIDEACTLVAMKAVKHPPGIGPFYERLAAMQEEKDEMLRMNDYYGAARINEQETRLRAAIDHYQRFYSGLPDDDKWVLKNQKDFVHRFIPSMENPQSLEEVLHELEWFIKSESGTNANVKKEVNSNSFSPNSNHYFCSSFFFLCLVIINLFTF
jgi:ATP-dependent Clp protease ATP-binding subunit ClpA